MDEKDKLYKTSPQRLTDTEQAEMLESQLKTETNPLKRLELLLHLTKLIKRSFPKKAVGWAEEAAQLAKENQLTKELGVSFHEVGYALTLLQDYTQALDYAEKALAIFNETGDAYWQGACLMLHGTIYYFQNKYDEAEAEIQQVLKLASQIENAELESEAQKRLGSVKFERGESKEAMVCYLSALKIMRQSGESSVLSNIATVYERFGDFPNALFFLEQSINLQHDLNDSRGLMISQINIGMLFGRINDYAASLEYFTKAKMLAEKLQDKHVLSIVYGNMGALNYFNKNFTLAINYFSKQLEIGQEINRQDQTVSAMYGLANIFIKIGEREKAKQFLEEALRLSVEIGSQIRVAQIQNTLAELEQESNPQKAIELAKKSLGYAEHEDNKLLLTNIHETLSYAYHKSEDAAQSTRHKKLMLYYKRLIYGDEQIQRFASLAAQMSIEQMMRESEGVIDEDIVRQAAKHSEGILLERYLNDNRVERKNGCAVQTFGEFELTINGRTLTKDDWQRKKARDLFKYLLIHLEKPCRAMTCMRTSGPICRRRKP
jgi:tetratricopeptide (TPR) repeat protein